MLLYILRCTYPFELVFLRSLSKYLVVQLLGCRAGLFLIFWGKSILFSRVAAPACIATNSARGFLFAASSPPPVVSCVFHFSHFDRYEVIPHCGLICISLLMSDVEHLLCVCWPSGCLLWDNVYSCLLPMFKSDYSFFGCWVVSVLYILWMLTLYQVCHLQISSRIQWVVF